MTEQPNAAAYEPEADGTDWRALWDFEAAKFRAETRTTSFLARLAHAAGVKCQRCTAPGRVVIVDGDERTWACDICVGRTPEFTERLATRMREDGPLLDRMARGSEDA